MKRRDFVLLLSAAMTAARRLGAQQKAMPVIGFLGSGATGPFAPAVAGFRQGLSETGWVEGQNVTIEYRWAEVTTIGCRRWPPISLPARST